MKSQNQWLIRVQTKFPNFLQDYNNCWHKVIIDTLEELSMLKNPSSVSSLRGLKKYSRKHFPYIKNEKEYESVAEKVRKEFTTKMNMDMFDEYRSHFPLIFTQKKEMKKQPISVASFIQDFICYPFNMNATATSVNFEITDLSGEQVKFMYNHIVDGVNRLSLVRERV
jgi:hypothetical protein